MRMCGQACRAEEARKAEEAVCKAEEEHQAKLARERAVETVLSLGV